MNVISHDSEVPAQGQQVFTAVALIHHNFDGVEKVFLAKRADTKKFLPGVYELPGGHIDLHEHFVDGLKREIQEEFEVDVNIGDPFAVFDYSNPIKGSHSVEVIYFATLKGSPDDIKLHPEDHSAAIWVAKDELDAELEKVVTPDKGLDNVEYEAVRKAFALLEGAILDLAGN